MPNYIASNGALSTTPFFSEQRISSKRPCSPNVVLHGSALPSLLVGVFIKFCFYVFPIISSVVAITILPSGVEGTLIPPVPRVTSVGTIYISSRSTTITVSYYGYVAANFCVLLINKNLF